MTVKRSPDRSHPGACARARGRRALSLLLACVMAFALLPAHALAETVTGGGYSLDTGTWTLTTTAVNFFPGSLDQANRPG